MRPSAGRPAAPQVAAARNRPVLRCPRARPNPAAKGVDRARRHSGHTNAVHRQGEDLDADRILGTSDRPRRRRWAVTARVTEPAPGGWATACSAARRPGVRRTAVLLVSLIRSSCSPQAPAGPWCQPGELLLPRPVGRLRATAREPVSPDFALGDRALLDHGPCHRGPRSGSLSRSSLTQYAPQVAHPTGPPRRSTSAAVPADCLYGLWGLRVLGLQDRRDCRICSGEHAGFPAGVLQERGSAVSPTIFCAGIVAAIMIPPIASLRLCPKRGVPADAHDPQRGRLALGATKWEMMIHTAGPAVLAVRSHLGIDAPGSSASASADRSPVMTLRLLPPTGAPWSCGAPLGGGETFCLQDLRVGAGEF